MKVQAYAQRAITTKYLGPTNHRGARIKATDGANYNRLTMPYDDELSAFENHRTVAMALVRKLGWGKCQWVGGETKDGYVFVALPDSIAPVTEYRILVVPSEYEIGDAEDADEVNAILDMYGAWGFVVESRTVSGETVGYWEAVDSCFGFLGDDANHEYMLGQALESIPDGYGSVPVCQEYSPGDIRQINTVTKK